MGLITVRAGNQILNISNDDKMLVNHYNSSKQATVINCPVSDSRTVLAKHIF